MKTVFAAGAGRVEETLPWSDEARERIARAPEMVRGMLVKEIEGWVARNHQTRVDAAAVQACQDRMADRAVSFTSIRTIHVIRTIGNETRRDPPTLI